MKKLKLRIKKIFHCFIDYQLENSTQRCYKIHSSGKTWSEARQHCQKDGGDLAIIRSAEVANVLTDMYANHDGYFETYHPWALFVGILEKTVGSWTTINGRVMIHYGTITICANMRQWRRRLVQSNFYNYALKRI